MPQEILCSVTSCNYNENAKNKCSLSSIQVAPTSHVYDGCPSNETNCSSYTKKTK